MRYGICELSVVPMRSSASHESELVSELLYNDIYEILEDKGEWLKIRCHYDSYEGWIRSLQHRDIDDESFNKLISRKQYVINCPAAHYNDKFISFGSTIYNRNISGTAIPEHFDTELMISSAIKLVNTPYRWGGKSIMGIDCSAFVQLCTKVAGYKLPRDASQQVRYGEKVEEFQEAKAGDLAFFKNEKGSVTHVGILISKDKIIHASGKVRIDSIDEYGIFNKELNTHTHILSEIKRIG